MDKQIKNMIQEKELCQEDCMILMSHGVSIKFDKDTGCYKLKGKTSKIATALDEVLNTYLLKCRLKTAFEAVNDLTNKTITILTEIDNSKLLEDPVKTNLAKKINTLLDDMTLIKRTISGRRDMELSNEHKYRYSSYYQLY